MEIDFSESSPSFSDSETELCPEKRNPISDGEESANRILNVTTLDFHPRTTDIGGHDIFTISRVIV